jgi:O-antigen ligase
LPIAGLVIAFSLFIKRNSNWPAWPKPFGWWAPVALIAVITLAMVNGYFVQGELSEWALVNKFAGIFVLMAYLGLAGWVTGNYGERFIVPFVKYFCIFFITITVIELSDQVLKGLNFNFNVRRAYDQQQGLMGNRNAYAFLAMTMIGLGTIYGYHKQIISQRVLYGLWVLFPIILIFNSSRTFVLCATVMFIILIIADWKKFIKVIVPGCVVGVLLFAVISNDFQKSHFTTIPIKSMGKLYDYTQHPEDQLVLKDVKATGDFQRLEIIKTSWELIKKYPLQGAGLGSALEAQREKYGAPINIIDNSGLWLLTETGLIGLGTFAAVYIAMAIVLFRKVESLRHPQNLLALAALWMMVFFAGFSLFHELLYTRFLWFVLGMTLVTVKTRQATQET